MKRIVISVALVMAVLAARAESPFRSMIATAVDVNPAITAQAAAARAEHAAAQAENTLEGTELEFEHLWAAGSSDKKWNVGVTQEFAFPGLYRARSQAAGAQAEASRLVLTAAKADKALSVKLLIIDIINAQARLDFYTGVGGNLARIAELTQKSFDRGNATILDLRKMRVAVMDNDRTLADLQADLASLRAQLEGYGVAVPDDAALWRAYPAQACEAPGPDTDGLLYAMSEASARASQARVKAVKLEAWPTVALGYRHAFEEAKHFNGLSIGLRLPSFSQGKRREAARLEAEAVAGEASDRIAMQTAENLGLYKSAMQLASTLGEYRELTGDDSYLQLLGKAYDGGELTIIDYLNEINIYSAARLNYLDLEYRYNLTLARLNRYRGLDF